MNNLFNPIYLDIKDKYRNLDVEASGKVKSQKHFPVFLRNGKEYIFKPLSRTKPFITPLYAFAECYWSNFINKFFCSDTPIYSLAIVNGLSKEEPKYYDAGTLVPSTITKDEKLVNLLEYFRAFPDEEVDIDNYINYCMTYYDYSKILKVLFRRNKKFGREVAEQVLLSILRGDYNFHYENVNFISENGVIKKVNPPIDFEFSAMFLFPDSEETHKEYYFSYLYLLRLYSKEEHTIFKFNADTFNDPKLLRPEIIKNIITIIKLYPDLVKDFLSKLEYFALGVKDLDISDESNFITPLNSGSWQIGDAIKNGELDKAEELKKTIKLVNIPKEEIFTRIKEEVLLMAKTLERILKIYLFAHQSGVTDLLNFHEGDLQILLNQDNELAISLKRYLEEK